MTAKQPTQKSASRPVQKDAIYIDVEDDITAIIGKIKDAKSSVIALVPPKRIGTLQSAVNLRLVHRAATLQDKNLVLITTNKALVALAAAASIPVAKNMQSKPEIIATAAIEEGDEDDVIDGSQLPIGDHARISASSTLGQPKETVDEAIAGISAGDVVAGGTGQAPVLAPIAKKSRSIVKVPNFGSFRRKALLAIGGVVLLVGALIWAIVVAPHARIIITARTNLVAANDRVTIGAALSTDFAAKTIKASPKEIKKDISVPFTATGKKDVGDKAVGSVSFATRDIENLGTTIPAGTTLTSSTGLSYVTTSGVTITIANYRSAKATISAARSGSQYNGATGAVAGAPSGITATIVDTPQGGTDKTVTVVTAGDIQMARDKATQAVDTASIKKELTSISSKDIIILEQSFKANFDAVKSNINPDQEVGDNKPAVAGTAVYSVVSIARSEASKYLDLRFADEIKGKGKQKVYDNGAGGVTFINITEVDGNYAVNLSTNGKIGPNISENEVKDFAKDKRYGEVQSKYEMVAGVESVDVKFSPFWVTRVPNNVSKMTIEFKVSDAK